MSPAGTPLALKSEEEALTLEIVMVELPEFVSVTLCGAPVVSRGTLPKFRLVEFAVSCALAAGAPTAGVPAVEGSATAALLLSDMLPQAVANKNCDKKWSKGQDMQSCLSWGHQLSSSVRRSEETL